MVSEFLKSVEMPRGTALAQENNAVAEQIGVDAVLHKAELEVREQHRATHHGAAAEPEGLREPRSARASWVDATCRGAGARRVRGPCSAAPPG